MTVMFWLDLSMLMRMSARAAAANVIAATIVASAKPKRLIRIQVLQPVWSVFIPQLQARLWQRAHIKLTAGPQGSGNLMLPGVDAEADDGGLAERFGRFEPVQALDQHEARAVDPHENRGCLLYTSDAADE